MTLRWRSFGLTFLSVFLVCGFTATFLSGLYNTDGDGDRTAVFSVKDWEEQQDNNSNTMSIGDNNSSSPRTTELSSPSPFKRVEGVKERQVSIAIWKTAGSSAYIMERFTNAIRDMKGNVCFEGCTVHIAQNQKDVDMADAVVFFMFMSGYSKTQLPARSHRDQLWIYKQHEPPPNFSPGNHLNGLFNWTMTYRLDSDVYQPYYRKFLLDSPLKPSDPLYFGVNNVELRDWIKGKTDIGTVVLSNCNAASKRGEMFEVLQAAGVPIDIYGGCGNRTVCGRGSTNCDNFWEGLGTQYKFYFAFENSLCSDYITEKFWRALELGMVPVVLGRARYLEVAPPKSYIDLRDFPSPEVFKEYILGVANDPEEYAKYFEWKRHYSFRLITEDFCDLCRKLREHKMLMEEAKLIYAGEDPSLAEKVYSKVYTNLTGWWGSVPGHPEMVVCLPPEKLGLGSFLK